MTTNAIFNLQARMGSNASQYANDLVRALRQVEQAARTPQGASSTLASFGARERVAIQEASRRNVITPDQYQGALRALEQSIAQARNEIGRRLNAAIKPTSPIQLERSVLSQYRKLGLDDAGAAQRTAALLGQQQRAAQQAADTARRMREAQQRLAQLGVDPRTALPPGMQALLGGPSPQALRALMGRPDYPRITNNLGQREALLRGIGLDIGVAQRRTEIANIGGRFDNTVTAGVRNSLAGFIRTVEQSRTQQQIYNQLTGRSGEDLSRAQRELAGLLERNRILATANRLAGTADPRLRADAAVGSFNVLQRRQEDINRLLGLQLGSPGYIAAAGQGAADRSRLGALVGADAAARTAADRAAVDAQARLALNRQTLAAMVGTQVAREQAADQGTVQSLANLRTSRDRLAALVNAQAARTQAGDAAIVAARGEEVAARTLLNRAINAEARRALIASLPPELRGTRTQQLQSYLSARQGGAPRLPTDFQTLPQILTSRLVTTAGFAASGALLYGGVNLIRDTIQDSTQLQQELVLVKSQFEDLANAGRGDADSMFRRYREGLADISLDAGVALNMSARLTRQLAGAFADDAGQPNFGRALTEGRYALRATQISGLDPQEITDDLTALSRAFDRGFEDILDVSTGFAEDYGVVVDEITNFTSRLAPTAAELGFELEQLAGLGAIAQQRSGVGGSALAEQFGRILPALSERRQDLYTLLARSPRTADQAQGVLDAFSTGDTPEVLRQLVIAYDSLDSTQRNTLTSLVGGRREAQAFYAVLNAGEATIRALNATEGDYAGEFDKRWRAYTSTLDYSIDRLKVAGEELGNALFRTSEEGGAGIGTGLTAVTNSLGEIVSLTGDLAEGLGTVNEFFAGMPGKILAAAAAYRLLQTAGQFALARSGAQGLLAGAFAAGGRFAPYSGYAPGVVTPGVMGPPAPVGVPWGGYRGRFVNWYSTTQSPLSRITGGQLGGNGLPGGPAAAGTFAGLGTMAAGLIAPVAIALALDQISQLKNELEGVGEEVNQEAQRLFADGLSREEVRRRLLAGAPDGAISETFGDRIRQGASGFLTDFSAAGFAQRMAGPVGLGLGIARNFFGDDPKSKAFTDAVQAARDTNESEELLGFFDALTKDDADFVTGLAEGLVEASDERREKLREDLGLESSSSNAAAIEAINVVLDRLATDPANEENLRLASELFDTSPADVQRKAEELKAQADEATRLAEQTQEATISADVLRTLFEARQATPQALVAALDFEIANQRRYAEAQRGTEFEADAFRRLTELENERSKVYAELFSGGADLQSQLAELGGGSPARVLETQLAAAQTALQQMAGLGVPYKDQLDQALEVERLRREKILEAIGRAGSLGEVDTLARQLNDTPVEVQRAIRAADLVTGNSAVAIGALQGTTSSEEFQGLAEAWRRAITETGNIPLEMQRLLEERLVLLRGLEQGDADARIRAQGLLGLKPEEFGDTERFRAEADAIEALLNQYGNASDDNLEEILAAANIVGDLTEALPEFIRMRLERRLEYLRLIVAAIIDDARRYGAVDAAERRAGEIQAEMRRIEEVLGQDDAFVARDSVDVGDARRRRISADAAVRRARAGDDSVAVARIAVQEAQAILGTIADTTSPEYAEAYARLIEAQTALSDAIRERATKLREAGFALRRARANGDPVELALIDIDAANAAISDARSTADPADDLSALADLVNANNALVEARVAREQARLEYLIALAAGDPVAQANLQVVAAQAAVAAAQAGSVEWYGAMTQLAQAQDAQRQAALAVADAQYTYLIAQAAGDPIRQAELRAQQANAAVAAARGAAERYQALANQLDAQKALRDAILDALIAQKELAGALYEAAGDTVGAARTQLEIARERLNAAIREGARGAELSRLQAAVVQAQTNLTNVQRNDRLGDLEYLYEFDKITANQYIALLTAELSKIPESNKEARREIERRIKALRDEMNQDMAFNLPDIIPATFYEARRSQQRGNIGDYALTAGVNVSYGDTIIQMAITEPGASAEEIATRTAEKVGERLTRPPTDSQTGRMRWWT